METELMSKAITPEQRKLIIFIIATIYVVSPIDLIPDITPILGQCDDLLVIAFALWQLFINANGNNEKDISKSESVQIEEIK